MTGQAEQASGVVKVRLSGELAAIEAVAALLSRGPGHEVEQIERSTPCPNRCDPGVRICLTVLIDPREPADA